MAATRNQFPELCSRLSRCRFDQLIEIARQSLTVASQLTGTKTHQLEAAVG